MDEKNQAKLARSVGKSIATMRLDLEMTQEQLAEALGIGSEAVSRIERGAVMPTLPRLLDVAEVFRCDLDELLIGSSSRPEEQMRDLWSLASQLPQDDRQAVYDVAATLCHYLRGRPGKRPRK